MLLAAELRKALPLWTVDYSPQLGAWIARTSGKTICQSSILLDRPGFLGGCDLWESWGSWHHGRRIPLSCGNGQ